MTDLVDALVGQAKSNRGVPGGQGGQRGRGEGHAGPDAYLYLGEAHRPSGGTDSAEQVIKLRVSSVQLVPNVVLAALGANLAVQRGQANGLSDQDLTVRRCQPAQRGVALDSDEDRHGLVAPLLPGGRTCSTGRWPPTICMPSDRPLQRMPESTPTQARRPVSQSIADAHQAQTRLVRAGNMVAPKAVVATLL